MPSGRLENENKEFNKIEEQLKGLPNIFSEYYYALRAEKKSYRTIQEYLKTIRAFMEYTTKGKRKDNFYKNVRPININKYMITLETKIANGETVPTSSSFRAASWYALNSFFEFLEDNGEIEINPVPRKSRPKITDAPATTYLTEEEVNKIIENIKKNAKNPFVNRDLCIFMLGVSTGLRIAAITQINIEDVDLANNVIRVIEKRNKTFDAKFSAPVKQVLISWIADRRKYFKDVKSNALFVSQKEDRISYDAVRKLLIKYSKGMTDKHVTPHVMRHTCATILYEKTGDIYLTAAQLHHSKIETTARYATISDKKQEKATELLGDIFK